MSAHTPGPWMAYDHAPYSVWSGDESGMGSTQIAACRVLDGEGKMASPYLERDSDRAMANARLIAAAPELLEALRRITDSHARLESSRGSMVGTLTDTARRIIRKAEGQS